jgi:hypothetical protein
MGKVMTVLAADLNLVRFGIGYSIQHFTRMDGIGFGSHL